MPENLDAQQQAVGGKVTVGHLLMMIAFTVTVEFAILEVRHAGGGLLRYVLTIPSALALGAFLLRFNWLLGRSIWRRSQSYSRTAQNLIALALLALDVVWMVLGGIAGSALARIVTRYVA